MAFGIVGGAKAQVELGAKIYTNDFSTWADGSFSWHKSGTFVSDPQVESGELKFQNDAAKGAWELQCQVASAIPNLAGETYYVRLTINGSVSGTAHCLMGTWSGSVDTAFDIVAGDQTVDVKMPGVPYANSWIILHAGTYVGTLKVKKVEVFEFFETYDIDHIAEIDYTTKTNDYAFWKGSAGDIAVNNHELVVVNSAEQTNNYDLQYMTVTDFPAEVGKDYVIRATIKGSAAGNLTVALGKWGASVSTTMNFTTDWQTVDVLMTNRYVNDQNKVFILFQSGKFVGTYEIKDVKVYEAVPARYINVGGDGFATFSSEKTLNMRGVTAYGAKYEGSSIILTPVTEVPANTGVIIEAAEGSYKVPVIVSASALGSINELLVSDGSITGNSSTIYALGKKGGVVGFVKVKSGVVIPKGKAYLTLPASARDFIGFGEDDITGIDAVKQEAKADNQYFNLAGQRVAQPTKGLYIVNGKKVIIK